VSFDHLVLSGTGERMTNTAVVETTKVPSARRGALRFVRDVVVILLLAVIVSVGVKTFLVRSFYIPSPSMTNTLQVQDRILVNELVPRLMPLQHGDVVVFSDPGGWLHGAAASASAAQSPIEWTLSAIGLTASSAQDHLVKRVIGLPGDRVECCTAFGQVSVNGSPLNEQGYIHLNPGATDAYPKEFSVTVPKDSLWVLGDNRDNSGDSGYHEVERPGSGFVPVDDVVGRAVVITWPMAHWNWLDDYPDVFAGVDR